MQNNAKIPPKRALKFLRWFCREDYLEEIEGDLREIFLSQAAKNPKKARRQFTWNVIKYFRPEFIKSFKSRYQTNTIAMFRHNLIISIRGFQRHKMSFFINLIGLSTGLACAMLICLWVNDELQMDKFHVNDIELYRVMQHRTQDGEIVTSTWVPGLTAQTLVEEMPEVERGIAAFGLKEYTLSVDKNDINATGQYIGKDFFNLFSFPLIKGDADQVLQDPNSIVISESLAKSLFNGSENAIGKTIDWQHENRYQVTGVFKKLPGHSSMQFDFLLSFDIILEEEGWAKRWSTSWPETYVQLKPGTDVNQLNEKIADLISRKSDGNVTQRTLFVAPYSKNYLYGKYENGHQVGGRIVYVRLFSVIAVFVLLIACFNFMNLSTAKAARRLKEVGIKKAIGVGRTSLIMQYMGEAMLLALLSFTLAFVLVIVFLPRFNQITAKHLTVHFDPAIMLSFLAIALFTGIVSGSYPALYISSFNPVHILKGSLNKSVGELWARKGLVILQFSLSVIFIVSVVVVYKQIEFAQTKNLGYNKDNIIYFNRINWEEGNLQTFITELKKLPGVVNASSIGHDMTGHIAATYGVHWPGKKPNDMTEFEMMPVNYDMLELLEIELVNGRTFSIDQNSERTQIIFNEAAIEHMGLKNPIGLNVELGDNKGEIVGVVKNIHFESLHEKVKPIIIWLNPQRTWSVAVKIEAGKEQETITRLQSAFTAFYPGFPFDFKFLDTEYHALYASEQRVAVLSKYFAGLAILISCLGLFGLAAFTAERKTKEIGIRKIMGSSELGIIRLLSADFTKMVLSAIVIALPISYFFAEDWLNGFAYRIDLQWWYFVGAGSTALLIAWFTVGFQTIKSARVNPIDHLRSE